ncbi:SDR family NAD(P)-dependent oxidoreductase [Microbacterium aquimaris]|uniref:SDR family NAD(P)-dependent oxidoreductase n=1 Tax=Microbacterium aquimaris TaxID=459816 RepID=A0ABU5N9T7_9MICO|nr:SDR family NAD(P)-dependent oxidoreductase [Microbacterium aquimaris]MDZ8162844.1 SDR family NAD(P)-dependent oxidoreductase [Microbacterium aquimaris]
MSASRFEGSRVIVTGAARGIGARIAERFAAEGANVVVIDRLREEGSARAEAIGGAFVQADLASVESTRDAMEAAVTELGGVDALVNNAGLLRFASLMETTPEQWDETFAVNSRSMLLTLQIAAREMVAAGRGGAIVNLASMAAKTGGAGQVAYAASKSAVVALTRVAALELGPSGIRVNAMCPGYVLTEMGADTRTPEKIAQWSSYSPLGRLGEPDDVAGLALFLASQDGAYLTGQAVNITGGMVMH